MSPFPMKSWILFIHDLRILISQSRNRDIPIITKDAQIGRYDVEIIWD